jgi:hypothetical protein
VEDGLEDPGGLQRLQGHVPRNERAQSPGDEPELPGTHRSHAETTEPEGQDAGFSEQSALARTVDVRRRLAQEPQSEHPQKGQCGQAGRECHQRTGTGQCQPQRQTRDSELLHERLENEPLGDEADRGRQTGQRHRARSEGGATPAQPAPDAAQRVEIVRADGRFDVRQRNEQG